MKAGSNMAKNTENRRKTGMIYERYAGRYLERMGYQILAYNYRCRAGEIDIVAADGTYLVFCEVKYRKSAKKGTPLEAVSEKKQRIIRRCALFYIMEHGKTDVPCRFDVVGIEDREVTLVRGAFEYE